MTNFTSNSNHFKIKDPGSAITHFIGMLMAVFAATPLIIRALSAPDTVHVIYSKHDSLVRGKHNIPHIRPFSKGQYDFKKA